MVKGKNYILYSGAEVEGIRVSAQKAATIRDTLCQSIRPGMSTLDLDQLAAFLIKEHDAVSAFHRYRGFPANICISINDEIVHGIGRGSRIIRMGDIVSVDIGIRFQGYIGDTAKTISIGPASGSVATLLSVNQKSLMAGIDAAIPGNTVRDISGAVERMITKTGFGIVRDFVGHGCGKTLHEPPEVPNYRTKKSREKLRPGMVLAIEPMVTLGTHKVSVDRDGWTARTTDGSWSSHFEHMVLITERKPEILTWRKTA